MLIDGPSEVRRLDVVIEILGRGLTDLSGDDALGHVRAAIAEKRTAERAVWRTERPRRRRRRRRRH